LIIVCKISSFIRKQVFESIGFVFVKVGFWLFGVLAISIFTLVSANWNEKKR